MPDATKLSRLEVMAELYYHDMKGLFELYRDSCGWFSNIGLEWVGTRYETYERHFSDFETFAESRDTTSVSLEFKRAFDNAYIEANEIVRLHSELQAIEKSQFIEQLKIVLSGQEFRGQVDNDKARDFFFELSTAARFLRAGYEVSMSGVCDVVASLPEGRLFIECKRVKSLKTIAKNVQKASEQIKQRIGKKQSNNSLGLIAINVTDLMARPDGLVLAPDSPQAAAALHKALTKSFVDKYSSELISKSTSKRLLGSMIESSAMWYLSDRSPVSGFSYTRHTGFIQKAKPEVLEALAPRICNQDIIR